VRMWRRPILIVRNGLGVFVVRRTNRAFAASGVRNMMGSWEWSIHPLFQSILG
jgi:hypothetical protein